MMRTMKLPLDEALRLIGSLVKQGVPHDMARVIVEVNESLGQYKNFIKGEDKSSGEPLHCECDSCEDLRKGYGGTE